jgi:prevent-host-death family protein
MTTVGVHEAKTNLSKLLRRVAAGEEVTILRGGRPVARLVPIEDVGKRELGRDAGRFEVPDDFNQPLPDDVVEHFYR